MTYYFYGTFLMGLIEDALNSSDSPMTVKQICAVIKAQNPTADFDRRFSERVRRNIKELMRLGRVSCNDSILIGHIYSFTYSTNNMSNKNLLRRMVDRTNEANAGMMMNMARPFIEPLKEAFAMRLKNLAQPVTDEGEGILEEGETNAGYLVTLVNGEIVLSTVAMTFDPEIGKMTMRKPVRTQTINQLIEEYGN